MLEDPQQHGLTSGLWYATDADETLLTTYPMHTLAGALGCSAQDLPRLESVFKSLGLFSRGCALGGKAAELSAKLGHPIFKPIDRKWGGQRYTWVAFDSEPDFSPAEQLTNAHGNVLQPRRTRLLERAIMRCLIY